MTGVQTCALPIWVILEFMELRHAPALWRNALLALFTLMVALVLLAWAVA